MTNYYKPYTSIDSSDKETELTTNPCQSEINCINKGALGKFFRKPDFGKIERKKKSDQGKSLLCYLTPKNCEDSTKMIKQKFKQNSTDLSINSFPSKSYVNLNQKQSFIKSSVNVSLVEYPTSKQISIEKGKNQNDRKIRISSFKENCTNEFKQGGITPRQGLSKLRGTSSFRNLKQSDVKRQDQQANQLGKMSSNKSISMNLEKEVKKMKAQCEHYSQQLQACTKQKQQSANQLKSLNIIVQQLKQRNSNLLTTHNQLQKDILQLTSQISSLTTQNRQLKQQVKHISDQKSKYIEEISYLKSNITDLNERIDIMLQTTPLSTPRNNRNLASSGTIYNGRRINSMCYVNSKGRESSDQEQLKQLVHQLQQQLKYSQVQVNMLKRVKMDVNKKNQQFVKLQRQNHILKNQIFQMKMANAIEEQQLKANKNIKSHIQNKSGFHPTSPNRNNFIINHKNNNKTKDYVLNKAKDFDNVSQSSDTLSLNLSLSPSERQREKIRS